MSVSLLQQFEDDLRDPMKAQRETLKKILTKMHSVETLRKHGIDGNATLEEFVGRLPLTDYDDYENLIRSVADGELDPSELVGTGDPNERLLSFVITSGTSRGKNKLIPWTAVDLASRMRFFQLIGDVNKREGIPSQLVGHRLTAMQKGLVTTTPSGLLAAGPMSQALSDSNQRNHMQGSMVSPVDICILDSPHRVRIYAHLLSGLLRREEVDCVSANYANEALDLFLLLEEKTSYVIEHLGSGVTEVDGLVDDKSLAILKPLVGSGKTELASIIASECRSGFEGIIPRLFPNCKHIFTVTSGAMIPYAEKLKFYAGSTPLISSFFGASEGIVGLNTDPLLKTSDTPLYTICPWTSFFEFLDFPGGENCVCLDKVEKGRTYELIVTTLNGMLRYKLGDVVRVAKFEHKTPVVEFLHRKGAVLALTAHDLVTEKQLVDAVSWALQRCEVSLKDYVFDADRDCLPPRYIMYFELWNKGEISLDAMVDFSTAVDNALCDQNSCYKAYRNRGRIGCIKLARLEEGTFHRYRAFVIEKGTEPSQFKVIRCINKNDQLRKIICDSASIVDNIN